MKNRFCKKLAAIVVILLSLAGSLHAQTAMQNEKIQFASDRVIVKLANTSAMRSTTTVPSVAPSAPNLGVTYSGIRLLNPSKGNAIRNNFSTMEVNDKQNNVYVLMLEEEGEQAVRRALEILNANPAVEIAEPDFYYQLFATPNDPMFSQQYALQRMNAPAAWDITTGSENVIVGIIDTGIDGTHPDLAGNLWVNPNPNQNGYVNDINGYDFVKHKGGIPTDAGSHGTHVSGIVGAKGNNSIGVSGINWNVSLAWLGVGLEGGQNISVGAVIEALNYANNHNIQITNNSYGGPGYSAIFENAIRNYNGLFVAAAGNEKRDNDLYSSYPANYNLPNVVSVASTDKNDNLSSFSNYGVNSVHIAAPGSNILSTVPNGRYEEKSGTSMASPYVAGVAALIKSTKSGLSPAQIKEILITTARYSNSLNGFGILDAYTALTVDLDNASTRIDLSESNPSSSGLRWTFSDDVYTISDGANVSITGNNEGSERRVEVMAGAAAYITLDNANIAGLAANQSPLLINSGANVTLKIVGTNTLTAGDNRAGIQASSAKLTINGTGSLTTTGGNNGAGIGGGSNGAGGNITISGEIVITATGGLNAQGIGRGSGSSAAGTFAINGNVIVIANSVGDTNTNNRTGGILFDGNTGISYGTRITMSSDVTIPANLTIPESCTLIVPTGVTLIIPVGVTLTNNGRIANYGVINIKGALMNNNIIVNLGIIYGTIAGNPEISDFPYIDLNDSNPFPQGVGWTFSGNVYTVSDGANVTFTGTSTSRCIEVVTNATANITLKGVTIQGLSANQSPLMLNYGANVTLTLEETNRLKAADYFAGIEVPQGTTLTIDGTGSVTAIAGRQSAGIGGSLKTNKCGNVIINGGIITTTGISGNLIGFGGAGIGGSGSRDGDGGNITINGGVITATGNGKGEGIGNGGGTSAGTLTMNGNAIVFANKAGDMDTDRKTGGILVVDNVTYWYGNNNFSLNYNVIVPSNNVLTIDENKTLMIPSDMTLTNNNMIINKGKITNNGTIINNGTVSNKGIVKDNGTIDIIGTFTGNKIQFDNIGGNNNTAAYSEMPIDVTPLFTIHSKAGTPTYTVETGSTGEGTFEDANLTVTKSGKFIIGLQTAETQYYAVGEKVISTLTVNGTTHDMSTGSSQLSIFPNPIKDDIFIRSDLPVEKVKIYSLTGNLLLQENNFKEKISVSDLFKGVYLLKVYTDKGITISKIIKD
ncbi:MAG: S8 family serine peptidase [Dysgonamonadaceae bacterium]|nr:S8 family serine peptidase [Dysgonamonadaceae bacterium]